jgi:ppGpp synthetase/RelA/SpoT-type nucleotidyltranferase
MEKTLDLYRKNHSMYNDFTHEMQDLVTNFLMEKNIRIHSIVSRIKGETSLKNKIIKKNYTKLEGITDLCGIRIITYFSDDVDLVANIIQEKKKLCTHSKYAKIVLWQFALRNVCIKNRCLSELVSA